MYSERSYKVSNGHILSAPSAKEVCIHEPLRTIMKVKEEAIRENQY